MSATSEATVAASERAGPYLYDPLTAAEVELLTHRSTRVDLAAVKPEDTREAPTLAPFPMDDLAAILARRATVMEELRARRREVNHRFWQAVAALVVAGVVTPREVARRVGLPRRWTRRAIEAHREAP